MESDDHPEAGLKLLACRIFDLGLRKFSSSTEFILAYLDYLSHLNEDNNTRVLFERVLTAGTLEPRDSLEVWNKFLEFETNIGDLASVVKVEKRRAGILEEAGIAVGENKHTIQVGNWPDKISILFIFTMFKFKGY